MSEPSDGIHCLCVIDCECNERCIYFTIAREVQPPPAPIISYPTDSIPESSPLIYGTAEPGAVVRICVDSNVCGETTAGEDGAWSWQYPGELTEGYHIVTAASISPQGVQSSTAYRTFRSEGFSEFQVTLTDAHEGSRFRTVALDLTIASTLYPVTFYYLLLPPGSPAPDEDQILSYTGPGLTDGTAARGSVELSAGGRQTVELTGREHAPDGALGVVDNLRYDVYVVAQAGEERSVVLSALGALSMPFASGRGISGDPYLIAELSRDEILKDYPDLAADRSPLGVDDTARMLRNIENAQALYENSKGTQGIRNSMALDYRLATSIDLSGYAGAEGGMGWTPLGYLGDYQTPRYFSGLLSGGNDTPIRGLTVIRDGLREIEGLFASSLDGEFEGLTLENTVIRLSIPTESDESSTAIGLLVTQMQGGSLKNITITGAEITVSGKENSWYSVHFGGIASRIQDLRIGEHLLVEHLNLNTPRHGHVFGPVGGMFANMSSDNAGFTGTVLDTVIVQDSSISSQGYVGGVAGSIGNLITMHNVICRRCSFLVNGEAGGIASTISLNLPGTRLSDLHCQGNVMELEEESRSLYRTSGGMFGSLSAETDDSVLNSSRVEDCIVTGATIIGGFAGHINPSANFLIEDCHVARTRISSIVSGLGGFCGRIMLRFIKLTQRQMILRNCTVQLSEPVAGTQIAGGFAGQCSFEGDFHREPYKVVFEGCLAQAGLSCTGEQIGGFIGLCNAGVFIGCRSVGRASGAARTGGFAGEFSLENPEFELSVKQCAANVDVIQTDSLTDGGFGGFAGRADVLAISQSIATGAVTSSSTGSGAFLGEMNETAVTDCYATGNLSSTLDAAGGLFGLSSGGLVEHCYCQGGVQGEADTGGIGGLCSEGETSIQNNLVLSPAISGSTPTGRILGGGVDKAVLQNNYATTPQVLQDGQLKTLDNDPNGQDGESITAEQIIPVLQRTGWSEELWDYSSVTGNSGPKLYDTPEQIA